MALKTEAMSLVQYILAHVFAEIINQRATLLRRGSKIRMATTL